MINLSLLVNIIKCGDILGNSSIQIVYRSWVENNQTEKIINQLENHYNVKINKKNVKLKENIYFNQDEPFIWPSLDNEYITDKGTCYGGRKHVAILVNGTVIPCCLDSKGIINLGNIFNENFKSIIESKRFNKIKTNFQNNKISEDLCQKCGYRTRL